MIEEVYPHIFRISVPLPHNPLKELNSYFLRGAERNLLIDTGFRMEECRQALLQAIAELDADMLQTDIFLTHLHSDHTGLAPEIATDESKVYLSKVDIQNLLAFMQADYNLRLKARLQRQGFSSLALVDMEEKNPAYQYAPRPFSRFTPVEDGDILHYAGYQLLCVSTPGHTPGHMCLYIESEKLAFLGDHVLFSITPNITEWEGFNDALGTYFKSLDRIAGYDIAIALPAHRGVNGTVRERVQTLKQHHQQRLQEIVGILRRQPGLHAYDVASQMSWSIRCNSWQDFPVKQKWFAVGEAASHLEYLVASNIARREDDGAHIRYWLSGE